MVMVFCVSVYAVLLEFFGILDEQLDVHVANGSLIVDLKFAGYPPAKNDFLFEKVLILTSD